MKRRPLAFRYDFRSSPRVSSNLDFLAKLDRAHDTNGTLP
jgi:hypothetical protein